MTLAQEHIHRLRQRYLVMRGGALALVLAGAGLVAAASDAWLPLWGVIAVGGVLGLAGTWWILHDVPLSPTRYTQYLNQRYPVLEHSADLLLLEKHQLLPLSRLQYDRVATTLQTLYPEIRLPNPFPRAWLALGSGLLVFAFLTWFPWSEVNNSASSGNGDSGVGNEIAESVHPGIAKWEVQIQPPQYTGVAQVSQKSASFTAPEGSRVSWALTFTTAVTAVHWVSGADSVALDFVAGAYRTTRTVTRSGFYQIHWREQGRDYWTDFLAFEVTPDQAPKVEVTSPEPYTQRNWSDLGDLEIVAGLSDDYGLTAAAIVATVSQGSGEGVKFREERFSFTAPQVIAGKRTTARRQIALKSLRLDPGDELYFYVEVFDNRVPQAQRSRSETYFVAVPDTTTIEVGTDEGLGADVMPDYFRSQRQIIIDTEKLLRERKKLTVQDFKRTSNELGFDQKTLRLKYGQFLGEEAESGIPHGESEHEGEGEHDEEHEHEGEGEGKEDPEGKELLKAFGHQHDTEHEHDVAPAKPLGDKEPGAKEEDPLAAFTHSHDNAEEATFFEQTVRAKLKAALAVMWDAELYLRLYEPEKSLPFQYTALRLLKEVSQDARIYVHRTGFEPPPLKEEKRLTADLTEVNPAYRKPGRATTTDLPAMRAALERVLACSGSGTCVSTRADRELWRKAGTEYALLALENPALIPGLGVLQRLSQGTTNDPSDWATAARYLWLALPERPATGGRNTQGWHPWEREWMREVYE